jgi:hypothetical protein
MAGIDCPRRAVLGDPDPDRHQKGRSASIRMAMMRRGKSKPGCGTIRVSIAGITIDVFTRAIETHGRRGAVNYPGMAGLGGGVRVCYFGPNTWKKPGKGEGRWHTIC